MYIKTGVVGAARSAEMRFGLTEPEGQQVPRFMYTTRAGPIPCRRCCDVAGPTDPETAAPDPREPLPEKAFTEIQGVIPNPAMLDAPLAGQEFGPRRSRPPRRCRHRASSGPAPVAKEGDGGCGDHQRDGDLRRSAHPR